MWRKSILYYKWSLHVHIFLLYLCEIWNSNHYKLNYSGIKNRPKQTFHYRLCGACNWPVRLFILTASLAVGSFRQTADIFSLFDCLSAYTPVQNTIFPSYLVFLVNSLHEKEKLYTPFTDLRHKPFGSIRQRLVKRAPTHASLLVIITLYFFLFVGDLFSFCKYMTTNLINLRCGLIIRISYLKRDIAEYNQCE